MGVGKPGKRAADVVLEATTFGGFEPLINAAIMIIGGDHAPSAGSEYSALRRPTVAASALTEPRHLAPPLRSMARELAPERGIVDAGGQGQCGPNSLAHSLALVGKQPMDGPELRRAVVDHLTNQRSRSNSHHWPRGKVHLPLPNSSSNP